MKQTRIEKDTGTEKFINFSVDQADRLTGDKIYIDTENEVSYMSPFFFSKWKNLNKNFQVIIHGNEVLACIQIGGNYYPLKFKFHTNFSPLVLGKKFLRDN